MAPRTPTGPWLTGIAVVVALSLAACGSGSSAPAPAAVVPPSTSGPSPTPIPPAPGRTGPVRPADVRVVRAWADTLRRGDIDRAARYFALPSIVSNGSGPIELRTRSDVRRFNAALPCGAVLTHTAPGPRGFVIATFRLTERPGPGTCGSGTGDTARTAFRIRAGQILDWLRVAGLPQVQGRPA